MAGRRLATVFMILGGGVAAGVLLVSAAGMPVASQSVPCDTSSSGYCPLTPVPTPPFPPAPTCPANLSKC